MSKKTATPPPPPGDMVLPGPSIIDRLSDPNTTVIIDIIDDVGPQGPPGPVGPAGPANELTIGTVEGGDEAAASITGTPPVQVLNLVLPTGPQGEQGDPGAQGVPGAPGTAGAPGPANELTIGTVTTGAPGSPAGASITGTPPAQTLDLSIPSGLTGASGAPGPANSLAIGSVQTGMPGSSANATISGAPPNQTLSLVIPRGDPGAQGPIGPQGPAGAAGTTDHGALTGLSDDDHPQYLTAARADALFLTPTEGDARYAPIGGGGGVTDHGALTGLADDDHPQYLNLARGDARYAQLTQLVTDHGALTGLADDDHPQYMLKNESSGAGVLSGGGITDAGAGAISIAAGSGYVRSLDAEYSPVVKFNWPAASAQALADGVFTYVYADYNGGTPRVLLSSSVFNRFDRFILGFAMRSGSSVTITQATIPTGNVARDLSRWMFLAQGMVRATGLITTETGTRNLSQTGGNIFIGLNETVVADKNTASGDTFTAYYRNGSGGWTSVAGLTQYDNQQYDDGDGTLATLPSGSHGVHWVFRTLEGNIALMYGQSNYTLAQAQAEPLPATRPPMLQYWHAVFCAKIIFQRGGTTAKQIDIAFTSNIGAGAASDHGSLSGLTDDDHPQYLTQARGDALYAPIGGGGGSGTPGGATTQIQYNNAGAFAGSSDLTFDSANRLITLGTTGDAEIRGGAPASATSIGRALTLRGGPAGATSGNGGPITLIGGTPSDGNGGGVFLQGGAAVGTNRNGGTIQLASGAATGSGNGGSVQLIAGTSPSGTAGTILLQTAGTPRLTILGNGGWTINGTIGVVGQVLTSAGNATPTWSYAAGEEGSFTTPWIGFTTSPNATISWSRVGKLVTLRIPAITGTSNSGVLELDNLPTQLRPSANSSGTLVVLNNGTPQLGVWVLFTSTPSKISFFQNVAGAAFTNTGNKGIASYAFFMTYLVS